VNAPPGPRPQTGARAPRPGSCPPEEGITLPSPGAARHQGTL